MGFGSAVYYISMLGSVICWILVLVQMFRKGVLTGILGLICGIYAFIWGWMNTDKGLKNVMVFWTITILLAIFGGFYFGFPSIFKL